MAILPNVNVNIATGYDNVWVVDNTITGTISHTYSYDYDKLWEFLYYAIIDKEPDATKRDMYVTLLKLNKNDFRNTVLAIEMEKNENLATEI